MEDMTAVEPVATPNRLSSPYTISVGHEHLLAQANECEEKAFTGGESAALAHLSTYFSNAAPASYKETRNALDGWTSSCKFSPWLASGCLSVRKILQSLREYETQRGANDSTYWIYFELLWREYFQWYAKRHGAKLFRFTGLTKKPLHTSFYSERFKKWREGQTPWAIVNACMNELNNTGYLSNRGRQIVASCLVNELQLDWRCGASYFEQQLIDYDVASNWGNWQYIAGVGADPRGGRHFNLQKQTQIFDPEHQYIQRWADPDPDCVIDSLDAVGWPVQ